MGFGVIRLKYGIENAGVDICGYSDGEFKMFSFYNSRNTTDEDKYQTIVLGSYEGYRDGLEFLMYHLLKVMNGEDFVLYHHKGSLYTTPNVTLNRLKSSGVTVHWNMQLDTHNDCWNMQSDNILLEL